MSEDPGTVLQYVEALRDRIGWLDEQILVQALEVTNPQDAKTIMAICREIEGWCNRMYNTIPKSPGGKTLRREQREREKWNRAKYQASPEGKAAEAREEEVIAHMEAVFDRMHSPEGQAAAAKEARAQFKVVKSSEDTL
jgi:hypothetical protein